MIVRPRRRTTFDPSFCFHDFSEFLTFIVLPLFVLSNGHGRASIPSGRRLVPGDLRILVVGVRPTMHSEDCPAAVFVTGANQTPRRATSDAIVRVRRESAYMSFSPARSAGSGTTRPPQCCPSALVGPSDGA